MSLISANDVVDQYLIAKQDRPIILYPNGPTIGTARKGLVLGPVYSWIFRDNKLYWSFDYTIPGNTPGSYYVLHKPEYWKISASGTGNNAKDFTPSSSLLPSIIPKWALPVAVGALALILIKK